MKTQYYIGSNGDDNWHKVSATTLTSAMRQATRYYQQSVGGKIYVGIDTGNGEIVREAVKYGFEKWVKTN